MTIFLSPETGTDVLLGLRQKLLGAGQEDYLDDASVIGWVPPGRKRFEQVLR